MRKTLRILFTVCIIGLMPVVAAIAQAPPGGDPGGGGQGGQMLRDDLERTDQVIEQAELTIQNSGNQTALEAFQKAKDIQQQAWEQFNKGTEIGNKAARLLTEQARELILTALRMIGGTQANTEQQDGFVLRRLERCSDLLDQAKDALLASENKELSSLYDVAVDNLSRAWEFYRSKQYRPALTIADQIENSAQKILQLAGQAEQNRGTCERRRENVAQVMDQTRQMLAECQSPTGNALYSEAQKAFDLAGDLQESQRYGAAIQSLQRARELALKASRECRGIEQLQSRYDRLQTKVEQLQSSGVALTGASKESFDRLLNQARDQLALASRFIKDGDWEKATIAIQAAQLAIREAEGLVH